MKVIKTIALAMMLITASSAQAEYFGLIAGREATLEKTSELTAELGIVTGELEGLDYQNIAARVSYLVAPDLL
jgi:hypothetical protein